MSESTDTEGHEGIGRGYIEDEFQRDMRYLDDRITADGSSGWPVEPGRYRLIVSRACPWANRAIIVRRLLGLEQALPMGVAGPTHDWRSWTFDLDPEGLDPVLGIHRLKDAYEARVPGYELGITVPAIVDVPSGAVVTNDFKRITLDLALEWSDHHRDGAPDLYPQAHREEIDEVIELVFRDVNNGVYQAGFAGTREAYERAYVQLFARLDWLSDRLATQRYLVGDTITEADVRLFTTLVRFDAVYVGHFKTNLRRIADYPNLGNYTRELYQYPGVAETVNMRHIKRHYYYSHGNINPTRIVPRGPALNLDAPHDRDRLPRED